MPVFCFIMRSILPLFFCIALCTTVCAENVLLDIELPLTAKSAHAATKTLERLTPDTATVFIQLNVRTNEEVFGRGSSFGVCYEFASLLTSERFAHVRFVAFMPQSVQGHAVLVALACNERIMAGHAEIGAAGIDEPRITATHRQAYQEIAKRRNIPVALADKLLDTSAVLLQVETEHGLRLVAPGDVDDLRQTETFAAEPATVIPAGQQGIFSAELARQIRLVDLIAEDRIAAIRGFGLSPDALQVIPIINEFGHAVRVNLNGVINSDRTGAVIRSIRNYIDSTEDNVNFLCLYIDSPGGNLEASLTLASFLVTEIDSAKVRTVAYIPYHARSDAALVAIACDEIVLGPEAVLGGDGARVFSADQIAAARLMIRESLAKKAMRSWSLPAALVDPDIEIFRAVRETEGARRPMVDYVSDEELAEFPDNAQWRKEGIVKPRGELLQIVQGRGEQFLVDRTAKDFAEFKLLYDLEKDPMLADPTWADRLLHFLQSPGMSALILMIVFFALMFEFNSPGVGVGVFVAIVGVVLFFWLNFLGGTAGWLEVLLFLAGVGCLLLEIFVLPGLGIFGIGGIALVLASLVLASQTFLIPQNSYQLLQFRNSLLILAVSGCGMLCFGFMLSRLLERINKPNDTETVQETERLANYDGLLGQRGTTATPLVPAGKARIGNELYDVVSDGDLIERNQNIEVVQVAGYKIVVKRSN
jgi:membrane-bound ClpP family serine protease